MRQMRLCNASRSDRGARRHGAALTEEAEEGQQHLVGLVPALPALPGLIGHDQALPRALLPVHPHGAAERSRRLLQLVVLVVDLVVVLVHPVDARRALSEGHRQVARQVVGVDVVVALRARRVLVRRHGQPRRAIVAAAPQLQVPVLAVHLLVGAAEVVGRRRVRPVILPGVGGVVGRLLQVGVGEVGGRGHVDAQGGVGAVVGGLREHGVHDLVDAVVVDARLGVDGVVGPVIGRVLGPRRGGAAQKGQGRDEGSGENR